MSGVRIRHLVIGALLVLIGLPVGLIVTAIAVTSILDETNGHVMSSGIERRYLLHVPPAYDRSKPGALVISLHGAGLWPAQQMGMTHWNEVADEHGFIVVYPAARDRVWRVERPGADPSKDARFIADLIDALELDYKIDPSRIYANGFSLGGAMTFALSCMLSDRIAAVGTVSAAQTLPWEWCKDHRPIPLINFHGTADLAPYEGGPSPDPFNPLTFPSVQTWTSNWARRNACSATPSDSAVSSDVVARTYGNCSSDATVMLYTVQGGGHAWPGGQPLLPWFLGPTTASIDATRRMWAFFETHPLRPPN